MPSQHDTPLDRYLARYQQLELEIQELQNQVKHKLRKLGLDALLTILGE